MAGTLESSGANGAKIPASPCKDYGYNGLTANASASPRLRGTQASNGANPSSDKGASLVNAVDVSADTTMIAVPEGGTVESNGANG